jgi:type I restriction enzyme S subunit
MKDKPKTLTPKLRFPEFKDGPGWSTCALEYIAERITTRNSDGTHSRVLTNSAERGVLDQREYFDREIAGAESIDTYYVVERGDYVYNPRTSAIAPVGPISRNNRGTGVMSPLYTVFRFTDNNTDFYEHYFKSAAWHSYLRSVASTGARHDRMSITSSAFMQMPVPTPDSAEQRKIADCLTSLDEWIAAEVRKLEAVRAHKKGLMQQLFPREGEILPRLRFPEFAGEWEKRTLGTLAEYENGKAYEQDICEDGKYVVVNSRFISSDGGGRKYSNADYCIATAGDVLMVLSDLPKGRALAKSFYVDENDRYAVNQRVARLTPCDIHPRFLYYRINRHPSLLAFDDGLNQTHLSKGSVVDCLLCVPRARKEQRRIAACLSSLDALIAAQSRKVDSLRTHKKGLMQQLFLSPEGE